MRSQIPKIPRLRTSELRLPGAAGVVGAFGSLLLHLLIFSAILYGGGRGQAEHRSEMGATALTSDDLPVGILILLDSSTPSPHISGQTEELGSLGQLLQSPLLTIASPTASPPNFEFLDDSKADTAPTDETTGNQRGRAALFGLYMRQIQARIERAWMQPAGGPPAGKFTCRVQITQSKRGEVEEVQLLACTDNLPWRLSLVSAIQTASPLPAPPDPRVFSDLLRLSFQIGGNPHVASAAVAGSSRDSALEADPHAVRIVDDSAPSHPDVAQKPPSTKRLRP